MTAAPSLENPAAVVVVVAPPFPPPPPVGNESGGTPLLLASSIAATTEYVYLFSLQLIKKRLLRRLFEERNKFGKINPDAMSRSG